MALSLFFVCGAKKKKKKVLRVVREGKLFFTYSVNWDMEQRRCMEFSPDFFFLERSLLSSATINQAF